MLLDAWPTLSGVAEAVVAAGTGCTVVQASWTVATRRRGGVTYHFLRPDGLTLERVGVPAALRRRPRLLAQIARLKPDVVHVHGLTFAAATHALGRALPAVPVLVQDHADRPRGGVRGMIQGWGLALADGIAFTAREQAVAFVTAGLLDADVPVFEVLESSSAFTPGDAGQARSRTGVFGDPCLLWLGHLDANKDPLTVLDGLSRAAAHLPDPHLWFFFRSAPLLGAVERRIATDPALRGRVHVLGTRPHAEVEHLLRAADFLVQGSHREGSGFAVIEALACGTTPLVTDIPSLDKITGGGAVGALSRPGDAVGMAEALLEWSRRDRAALRSAARAHFERELSFEAIGRQLCAAYQALLDRA